MHVSRGLKSIVICVPREVERTVRVAAADPRAMFRPGVSGRFHA